MAIAISIYTGVHIAVFFHIFYPPITEQWLPNYNAGSLIILVSFIVKEVCLADTTTSLDKAVQSADSALAVNQTLPQSQDMISKEKAMQLADTYLKSQKLFWGKPASVALVHQSSSILVEGADHKMYEETWDSCYYVQYKTSKSDRELTGIKTVAVTRDGLKMAIPASE